MQPGEIYRHAQYYIDLDGKPKPKFFLVLALTKGGDLVLRLLTSKPRPRAPPCNHGAPYPSYYLGILGGTLSQESSVDLRPHDDLDGDAIALWMRKGIVTATLQLDAQTLCVVLECAAAAADTTTAQERAMRDVLATLR